MANGRVIVPSPVFTPLRYGLLSAATDSSASAPPHWQAGITWQSQCPDGEGTYDSCVVNNGIGGDTDIADPPVKIQTTGFDLRGATSFAVYARFDCSPVGFIEQSQQLATDALTRVEGHEVERIFDSGIAPRAGGSPVTVYPHLRATADLDDDSGATLQTGADIITAVPVDPVEALSRIEGALADCYFGQGVIHVPARALNELVYRSLVSRQGDQLVTTMGNRVAVGSGYSGASPAGVVSEDVAWIYATGTVFYYRSQITVTNQIDSFDRNVNTVQALAERQYVLGWDCCHLAIPMYLGGTESGEFDSAGALAGGS